LLSAHCTVGQRIAVGVEKSVVGLTVGVDIDYGPSAVLDTVEPEPSQLAGPVDAHRPGARAVVGEVGSGAGMVAHEVVGEAVSVEVGHRVVDQTVTVE